MCCSVGDLRGQFSRWGGVLLSLSPPGAGCRGTREFVWPGMVRKTEHHHPAALRSRLHPRTGVGQVCRGRRSGEGLEGQGVAGILGALGFVTCSEHVPNLAGLIRISILVWFCPNPSLFLL